MQCLYSDTAHLKVNNFCLNKSNLAIDTISYVVVGRIYGLCSIFYSSNLGITHVTIQDSLGGLSDKDNKTI